MSDVIVLGGGIIGVAVNAPARYVQAAPVRNPSTGEGSSSGGATIDDSATSSSSQTYSITKIKAEIAATAQATREAILGGAGSTADTLKELGDLIGGEAAEIDALQPRVMPLGGEAGSMLSKASGTDNDVAWTRPALRLGFFCKDKPDAGETFGPMIADTDGVLPNGLTTSISNSGAAAASAAVLTVKQGTKTIGTITYATGSTTGVFATTTAADVPVKRSDRFFVTFPATQDATLADVGCVLVGRR